MASGYRNDVRAAALVSLAKTDPAMFAGMVPAYLWKA